MNELAAALLLCAGCHGMGGEGRPAGGYPPIAGQPEAYLQRQLEAYADGRRADAVMGPLAQRLSAEDRQRIAAHFAALQAPSPKALSASGRGHVLATVGDNALRVQACQNCHGPGGAARPPFTPYLAGLHSAYLSAEMHAFRSGTRRTDPSGQMNFIARHLGEDDIAAVAAHYAGAREQVLK
jgi:cytochrome c553